MPIKYTHVPLGDYCTVNFLAKELKASHRTALNYVIMQRVPYIYIGEHFYLIEKAGAERVIERRGKPT